MCEFAEIDFITITADEAEMRIDKVLTDRYSEVRSRTYFQYLIQNQQVLVNQIPVKKRFKVKVGDEVEIRFVLTPELDLTPENIPLEIIYEDADILVINKSAGTVVHPAPGNWSGTIVNALLYHCNSTKECFDATSLRPGIVHRLDKDTSGVLIMAKNILSQQKLVELFLERKISKEYIAICCGNPGDGEVEAPIGRHPYQRKMMCVREDGKPSTTRYKTLVTNGKISIVQIQLITGRTHQIRVHMKHLGFPVLGDSTYGNIQLNKSYGVKRQLLHARSLALSHPITADNQVFQAAIPPDMKKFLIY